MIYIMEISQIEDQKIKNYFHIVELNLGNTNGIAGIVKGVEIELENGVTICIGGEYKLTFKNKWSKA